MEVILKNDSIAPSGGAGGGFLGYPALLAMLGRRFAFTWRRR